MKIKLLIVPLMVLYMGAGEASYNVPLWSVSKHIPSKPGMYQEVNPSMGIEYHRYTLYTGGMVFIDSYNKRSIALWSGLDFMYHYPIAKRVRAIPFIEGGMAYKGVVYPGDHEVNRGVVPYVQPGVRVTYMDRLYGKLGVVPVPSKYGSSVITLTIGIKFK